MFQTKVVQKIKTHNSRPIAFLRKSTRLRDNVVQTGTSGQATNDNIIQRKRFACRINKHTHRIWTTFCSSTTVATRKPL